MNYFREFLMLTAGPEIFITDTEYDIFWSESRNGRTSAMKNWKSFGTKKDI